MKRLDRMLFLCLDEGDAPALGQVLDFARRVGARLDLAAVAEEPGADLRGLPGLDAARLAELVLEERRDALAALRARIHDGAELASKVLVGTAFIEVIREVMREAYDLVAVPAPSEPGALDRVLPSTATHLIRKCPCPVWLVRTPAGELRRVGAAVDADPEESRNALDGAILAAALRMARASAAPLAVLHALTIHPSAELLRVRAGLAPERVAEHVARALARVQSRMQWLVAEQARDFAEVAVTTHVVRGRAGRAIPSAVEELGIDLLVMGTVGRTGIPGLLIGNTAEEILARTRCSIVAIKPPGFESPVALG